MRLFVSTQMLIVPSFDVTLSLPNITRITNKFIHSVESEIFWCFSLTGKTFQIFERFRYRPDMCLFAVKLANFGNCFLGADGDIS